MHLPVMGNVFGWMVAENLDAAVRYLIPFANFGYQTQLTGPDSSHQNGPGKRPASSNHR